MGFNLGFKGLTVNTEAAMQSDRGQPQAVYSQTHTSQIIQTVSLILLRQINTSRMVYFPCNTTKTKFTCTTNVYMQYFK
jgi:hypothetical protein